MQRAWIDLGRESYGRIYGGQKWRDPALLVSRIATYLSTSRDISGGVDFKFYVTSFVFEVTRKTNFSLFQILYSILSLEIFILKKKLQRTRERGGSGGDCLGILYTNKMHFGMCS
jgi:hypothetical protein